MALPRAPAVALREDDDLVLAAAAIVEGSRRMALVPYLSADVKYPIMILLDMCL
jgi:hypothetical protein